MMCGLVVRSGPRSGTRWFSDLEGFKFGGKMFLLLAYPVRIAQDNLVSCALFLFCISETQERFEELVITEFVYYESKERP